MEKIGSWIYVKNILSQISMKLVFFFFQNNFFFFFSYFFFHFPVNPFEFYDGIYFQKEIRNAKPLGELLEDENKEMSEVEKLKKVMAEGKTEKIKELLQKIDKDDLTEEIKHTIKRGSFYGLLDFSELIGVKEEAMQWKEDSKSSFWETFSLKDLEMEDEKLVPFHVLLFQLIIDEKFREKIAPSFFCCFYYFFPESLFTFNAFYQIYQAPNYLSQSEKPICEKIQSGVVELLKFGFYFDGQFSEIIRQNKLLSISASKFAENLNEIHAPVIRQALKDCLSKKENDWKEIPTTPLKLKLKPYNIFSNFSIEKILIGKLKITDLVKILFHFTLFLFFNLIY